MSQQETGEVLGVDHSTVNKDLKHGENPPPDPSDDANSNTPAMTGGENPPDPELTTFKLPVDRQFNRG